MAKNTTSQNLFTPRPPIITVLGHVDHGKTTLLDSIRKTNIATEESGGITQHIGAYQISTPSNKSGEKHKITFIDTPGHQAFAKMRARGADVADIAILVIAADDGVMPQTKESLSLIQKAKIPFIITLNKIDLPDINIENIKQQLVRLDVHLEEYGGETPVVSLSAKTGKGIDKLLSMILLLSELNQVRENSKGELKGVVIESTLSKTQGPMATVIIRSGSLHIGEEITTDTSGFKIRAIRNWQGELLNEGVAGMPVEILGWKQIPPVGAVIYQKPYKGPTPVQLHNIEKQQNREIVSSSGDNDFSPGPIKFIIKADTAGTLEAILSELCNNKEATIITHAIGAITESDVLLAKTTKAIIIGFHTKLSESVTKLAASEKVVIKTYSIIYELLDEIDEVITAIKQGNLVTTLGEARVQAIFPIKGNTIAGVKVVSGRIARGDQIKLMRGESEIGRTRIKSLRHAKDDITVANQGEEAGLILSQSLEILTDDSIISIG